MIALAFLSLRPSRSSVKSTAGAYLNANAHVADVGVEFYN